MTMLYLRTPKGKKEEYINGFAAIQVEDGEAKETFSLNDKKTFNYYVQLAKNLFSKKSVNVTPQTAHLQDPKLKKAILNLSKKTRCTTAKKYLDDDNS